MAIRFLHTVPILRMFSLEKAKEFYVGYLGFKVDWEHQFPGAKPVYMQVSRDSLVFHLSEHYGDGTPGSAIYVQMEGVEEFHRELTAKNYDYLRPGLDKTEWNTVAVNVLDPFGNNIRFNEPVK
jgi:catechol 2,3-dioxygenase-like lactoylglutathione lyase family enzyme